MSDRQGVEIDYCPKCRGVWLDRGELDKIIERSSSIAPPAAHPAQRPPSEPSYVPVRPYGHPVERHRDDHDDHGEYGKHHRKGSWLRELFD
jgi:Zn-finger nucleic acid-binding protein